jgi:integrase/recombinase XerD
MEPSSTIATTLPTFFAENATTIRSAMTRTKWSQILLRLQDRYQGRTLDEFTSDDLRTFLLFEPDGRARAVSPGTILTGRTVLRSFFSWAAFAGLIESDPSAVLVRTVRVRPSRTRQCHWLSSQQVSRLFEVCNGDTDRLRGARDGIVLGLGVFCGLRVHEIVKVRWSDLNLSSAQLFVLGKGGKAATLPVPPQLVELLFAWQGHVAQGLGRPASHDDPVLHPMKYAGFGAGRGAEVQMQWAKPLGSFGARSIVNTRGAQIGVSGLAPHDLRRSFAGLLEEGGVTLREISGLLRHSSVATTEKYLNDNPGQWKDAVSAAMAGIVTSRPAA